MRLIFIVFMLSGLIYSSCKTQEKSASYSGTLIVFGSGGGYSGQEIQYTLDQNGLVTRYDNISKQTTEITKLTKKQTKAAFEKLDQLVNLQTQIYQPGNVYYFLKELRGNKEHKVVWGASNYQVPGDIQEFFDQLMGYITE